MKLLQHFKPFIILLLPGLIKYSVYKVLGKHSIIMNILVQHLALNLEIIRIQLPKLRTMELLKFHLRF